MGIRAGLLTVLGCAAAASLLPGGRAQGQHGAAPTVIELFTSQGCSSCPAADALLKTYSERPGTIALSLSVDYWDHLGWKDTLASPKNTARQKAYAKALGTGNVYTPQIVIDGIAETIGNQKPKIEKVIAHLQREKGRAVGLTASSDGKRITIDVNSAASQSAGESATVWLAVVSPRVEVEIKRGENRGRTLSYHNVVRDITPIGMWSGQSMRIELPASAVMEPGARCVVLLQAGDGGRIIGATWISP